MKKFQLLVVCIFLFFIQNTFAQNKIKIGDKAKKINITDYLLNIPKDKNFDKKFMVIEFWATWCAPCLEAVPHINDLQNEFKNEKKLVFLSFTDEKPEKIQRTLEKIDFKTIVVSDQTKETQQNFDVESIPYTVLVDNQNTIKWIGMPHDLNKALIEKFLSGSELISPVKPTQIKSDNKVEEKKEVGNQEDKTNDVVMGLLKDKNTPFMFTLMNAKKGDSGMAIDALIKGKYMDMNSNLTSMIAKIIKQPESQIKIPENLVENRYSVIYKNANKMEVNAHSQQLKNNLLNALNLTEQIETQKTDVYNLKVVNSKKLNISSSKDDIARNSSSKKYFIFENSKIETLIKEIGNHHKIIISNETGLKDNLDFLIKRGSLTELMGDLEKYGLSLEKTSKEINFYTYK